MYLGPKRQLFILAHYPALKDNVAMEVKKAVLPGVNHGGW